MYIGIGTYYQNKVKTRKNIFQKVVEVMKMHVQQGSIACISRGLLKNGLTSSNLCRIIKSTHAQQEEEKEALVPSQASLLPLQFVLQAFWYIVLQLAAGLLDYCLSKANRIEVEEGTCQDTMAVVSNQWFKVSCLRSSCARRLLCLRGRLARWRLCLTKRRGQPQRG